jgi:hypothetical protein
VCAGVLVLMVDTYLDRLVTSGQALGPTAKDEWVAGRAQCRSLELGL